MCELNWQLVLEYLKVFLSWPPMALAIVCFIVMRFQRAIDSFLRRLVEGNFFGQQFKAIAPHEQQLDSSKMGKDGLAKAAEAQADSIDNSTTSLPPQLQNDPQAPSAIAYVRANPVNTVIEYKRLYFNYTSERLYNQIYGTQIALLENLSSNPTAPMPLPQLAKFHNEYQLLSKSTDYQLRDYVNFLINYEVISAVGSTNDVSYKITAHGVEFLSYIKANYPAAWNQRAF